jgi:hypothetical protein
MAFYKLKERQIHFKLNRAAKTCTAHDHFSISSALTYATKRSISNIRGPEMQLDADAMKQQLSTLGLRFRGETLRNPQRSQCAWRRAHWWR